MKKKNGIPAIALVLFLSASLWGCQRQKEEPGKPEGYQIYYINKEETAVVREPYEPEGQTTEELLDELLALLSQGGEPSLVQEKLHEAEHIWRARSAAAASAR